MKKKLLLLGLILLSAALAAGPVAALAGTTGGTLVTGQVTEATISITSPSPIVLANFTVGDVTGNSTTPGTVIVTAGTAGYPVAYSILATDNNTGAGRGFMMDGIKQLSPTNKFYISYDGVSYSPADTGFTYSGSATNDNATNLPFHVKQTVSGNETAGTYKITVVFTASIP